MPGAIALITPVLVGFVFGPEVLGGLLAGVTVSGVLMGIFQSNAGGAWDNAKKSFEKGVLINGEMFYKKSEPHKASVTGDTVGDPFKDTSGPSMNILIKLMSIVSLVIAPYIAVTSAEAGAVCCDTNESTYTCVVNGEKQTCSSQAQCDSMVAANVKDIAEVTGAYTVDGSHSSVDFSVKHIISDTKGSISIDSGFVNLQNTNGPKIYVQMDMTSLTTQNSYRDDHLKNKSEYFDVPKNKKASFEAMEVIKNENNEAFAYTAKGKLTLKGVSKDIELMFNYQGTVDGNAWIDNKEAPAKTIGFEGETTINRSDFGINGGGAAENVKIKITLEAVQPK